MLNSILINQGSKHEEQHRQQKQIGLEFEDNDQFMEHRSKAIIAQANSTLFNNKEMRHGINSTNSDLTETPDGDPSVSIDNNGQDCNTPSAGGHKPSLFAGAGRRGWGEIIEEKDDSMEHSDGDTPKDLGHDGKLSPGFNRTLAEIAEESEMKSCKSFPSPYTKERKNESFERISHNKSQENLGDAENNLDGTSFGDSYRSPIPSKGHLPEELAGRNPVE